MRPNIGTVRGAANLNDESYLDFVEGMRFFNLTRMVPRLIQSADTLGKEMEQQNPKPSINTLFNALDDVPAAQLARRMMRSTQMMMWRGCFDTYKRTAAEQEAWMKAADEAHPERVRIDPDFQYPQYLRDQDIHLQPGSYQDADLAGHVFHYGSKIFFTGANDDERIHGTMVEWCPIEGEPEVIVDVACGIGSATTALKQRYPNATVHGIDVAAPMVRYANARAQDMGLEIFFSQQDAAKMDFADNSVDFVMCMILFHELPPEVTEQVVSEVARILKPGGMVTIVDFPHIPQDELSGRHCMRLFDSWFNGEPFAPGFVRSDFTSLLKRHFSEVNPDFRPAATTTGALQIRVCKK